MKRIIVLLILLLLCSVSVASALPGDKAQWQLCWNANTESDLSHYDVYWRASSTAPWTEANSIQVALSPNPCQIITGLVPFNYEVTVTASDLSGNESGAAPAIPFAKDGSAPLIPSGAAVSRKP